MNAFLISPSAYPLAKLKTLPLRDQPAYRVTSNAAACSLAELLAAVVGGAPHVAELGSLRGVGQQTAVRIKAALALGLRLHDPVGERPVINSPSDAAALVQYEMSMLEQECDD
jgi:DNA repair protein RadC